MSDELNPENKCAHVLVDIDKDELPTISGMFEMQLNLQKFYAKKGKAFDPEEMTNKQKVDDITEQWRNMTLEFAELLERLPFKRWKTYTPKQMKEAFEGENLIETQFEYIDMWHFFMNIGLSLGIDGELFSKLYLLKNKENYARQERGY